MCPSDHGWRLTLFRRFILYHPKRRPREMGVDEIRQYLSYLVTNGKVAAATQSVALCALLFLYRQVLAIDLPNIENVIEMILGGVTADSPN